VDKFKKAKNNTNNIVVLSEGYQCIPSRYRGLDFDDYKVENEDQKRTLEFCKIYISEHGCLSPKGCSIIFSGGIGNGKTMLAMIMKQSLMKMGYAVQYESLSHFFNNLYDKVRNTDYSFQDAIDEYLNSTLLIIDDVVGGSDYEPNFSERDRQILFTIVDQRCQKNLSTIIISHYNLVELKNLLGDDIIDRLNENGFTLIFNWPSYRQRELVQWEKW
jgi:DNA replication protein DnaC